MRDIIAIAVAIAIFSSHAFAQLSLVPTVYIQSSGVEQSEFQGFTSSREEGKSLAELTESSSPTLVQRKSLNERFELAQREYLSGSLTKAYALFSSILELSRQADWNKEERRALLMCYMRAAQLAPNETAREKWLREAVRFVSDLEPESKFFPPPLMSEYKRIEAQEKHQTRNWDIGIFRGIAIAIRVNGVKYDLRTTRSIPLRQGPSRITILSNRWLFEPQVISPIEAINLVPPSLALAEGTCEHPMIQDLPNELQENAIYYYSEDCQIKRRGMDFVKIEDRVEGNPAAHSSPKIKDLLPSMPGATAPVSNMSTISQDAKPSESHTTLWIVGGVIVAGIIAGVLLSQKHEDSERKTIPTHQ